MHRKLVFALAGIFLAAALFAAPVILFFEGSRELVTFQQNILGHQTSGNVSFPEQLQPSGQNSYSLILVVEVVFIFLFAITLYYGISRGTKTSNSVNSGKVA